jgi:hypothetical protein
MLRRKLAMRQAAAGKQDMFGGTGGTITGGEKHRGIDPFQGALGSNVLRESGLGRDVGLY